MNAFYVCTRFPFACLIILLYSFFQFHSKKQLQTATYTVFRWLNVFGVIHVLASVVTEYTVNNRDSVPRLFNEIWHIIFLVSISTFLGLLLYYLILNIEKGLRRPLKVSKYLLVIFYTITLIGEIFLPISYVDTPYGSYSFGMKAYSLYVFVAFMIVTDILLLALHAKAINRKKSSALIASVVIFIIGSIVQIVFPYILLTGFGVTLIIIGLMLTMEDSHIYVSPTSLYNKQGCLEIVKELIVLQKPFQMGIYVFVGNSDDITNAMLSIRERLPQRQYRVICGMMDDDTLVVLPMHSLRNPYPLPTLPVPHLTNPSVSFTTEIISFENESRVSSVIDRILNLRDTYEESVLQNDELTATLRRPSLIYHVDKLLAAENDLTFLMFDLDDFKCINDTYGHQAGDRVLQKTAEALRTILRSTDIICRMGGDEFGVALPGLTDFIRIRDITSRLRNKLKNIHISDTTTISITCSIGVCVSNESRRRSAFSEMYAEADGALYHAKSEGKCRLVFSGDRTAYPIEED